MANNYLTKNSDFTDTNVGLRFNLKLENELLTEERANIITSKLDKNCLNNECFVALRMSSDTEMEIMNNLLTNGTAGDGATFFEKGMGLEKKEYTGNAKNDKRLDFEINKMFPVESTQVGVVTGENGGNIFATASWKESNLLKPLYSEDSGMIPIYDTYDINGIYSIGTVTVSLNVLQVLLEFQLHDHSTNSIAFDSYEYFKHSK